MKLIGLTGMIASGKSTVSDYLMQRGYKVIDADKIAHELTGKNKKGYFAILKEFPGVLGENEEIDRKKLSDTVFSDKKKLNKLNGIIHPVITDEIDRQIYENKEEKAVFLDAPLLFESGLDKKCDMVLLITVNRSTQIDRLVKRDNISIEKSEMIISSQMDTDERKEKVDVVISNDATVSELKKKIDLFLKTI